MLEFDLPYHKRVLGAILEEQAHRRGDKVYLFFEDQKVTYAQLKERVDRIANGLRRIGVDKGDRVCCMLPNLPETIYCWLALAKLGATDVPVHTAQRGESLKHVVNTSGARLIVTHPDLFEQLSFVEQELPNVERVVVVSEGESPPCPLHFATIPFQEVASAPPEAPQIDVVPSDVLTIMFTSGTTGPSKGAVLPHHYCYVSSFNRIRCWRITEKDVMYTCLPLSHTNARFSTVATSLQAGASMALGRRFSASRFWDEVRRYGATEVGMVGPIARILYDRPRQPDDADNPVRFTHGVGSLSPEQQEEFEDRFALTVGHGMAMTEISPYAAGPLDNRYKRLRTSGKPLVDCYDVRIVDDNDNPVPTGSVGEIIIRPLYPYSMVMEYYQMPEATLKAFRNLWFHTGDLGRIDEDGYIYYVDRKKDAVRRRGEMLSSYEVESTINLHPAVDEAAVVGVPAEIGEEEVMTFIRLKIGATCSPPELLDFCRERLAYFMLPRYVEFVSDFPRTRTGKIEKAELRKRGVSAQTWDREKAGYQVRR